MYMCCCSPMQRNVSTVPFLHKHTAKFTCVAARRCKETSRLYRFSISTPRNLHVLLLADAKKRLDCTDSPYRHTAKFACAAAGRCKETARLYGLTMVTPVRQRLSKTRFPCVYGRKQQTQRLLQAGVPTAASSLRSKHTHATEKAPSVEHKRTVQHYKPHCKMLDADTALEGLQATAVAIPETYRSSQKVGT